MSTLERALPDWHNNGVRRRVIGEHAGLGAALRGRIAEAQAQTDANTDMTLVVVIGYGGQWDIVQAAQRLAARGETIDSRALEHELVTAQWPALALLFRSGGESSIRKLLLWQFAHTELNFHHLL